MRAERRFLAYLRLLTLLLSTVATGLAVASDQVPAPPQGQPVLLRGGDLYTVANGVKEKTDLLFDQGRIVAIGRDLTPPPSAVVIELRGERVYPGLIAPQTPIGLVEVGAVRASVDRSEVGEITPEVTAHSAWNPDSEILPTVRAHGITTVQVVPSGSLVAGRTSIVALDGWTKEDAAVRLLDGLQVVWPSLRRRGRFGARPDGSENRQRQLAELRAAFASAAAYGRAREVGAEVAFDLRWQAMAPALAGEQTVYVVANDRREIAEVLEFAAEFDLRWVLVGGQEADQLASRLHAAGVPVLLTQPTSRLLREDDPFDAVFSLPAKLAAAEVPFAIAQLSRGGTDVRNLPLQAGRAVGFGLGPEAALRAITLSTAEILGISDRQGSLEVGKQATLFVSQGDVMDPLTQRVTRVWINGREIDLGNRHKTLFRKYDQRPHAGKVQEGFSERIN